MTGSIFFRSSKFSTARGRVAAPAALLVALVLSLVAPPASALAPIPSAFKAEGHYDGAETHISRPVAPGVVHRFDSFSTGPVTYNTVTVDMSRKDLALEAEKGLDTLTKGEALDKMVERLADPAARPIVAINADFWGERSIPIGLFVDEGMIWKSPYKIRSVFAFDDRGNLSVGPAKFSAAVKGPAAGQRLDIDRINFSFFKEDPSRVVAYTWPRGEAAPKPEAGQTQVVLGLDKPEWLPNAPAAAVVRQVGGEEATSLGDRATVVLMLDSKPPEWLKKDAKVTLDARFENLPGTVLGAVGGGPMLVRDGKIVAIEAGEEEAMGKNFVTDPHPRTAVGLKADGKTVVFVVVDGRQPGRSVGINLPDLAEWMKAQGCVNAMNLDGGGSSTMVVRGEIVNFPSDAAGPRPVSNAVVLRRTAPVGPLARLEIEPRNAVLPPSAKAQLRVQGYDEAHEPVSLDGWIPDWQTRIKEGDVSQTGLLETGPDEIQAEVRVQAIARAKTPHLPDKDILETVTTFDIVNPATIDVAPPALLLETGDEQSLRFNASTADGRRFLADPSIWEITVPPFLRFVPAEGRVKAVGAGTGFLTARLGAKTARVPVAVDQFKQSPAYSFDTLPAGDMGGWIQGANYEREGTSVALEKGEKKEGEASWSFTYAMAHGGVTKIALPVDATLPGKPLAVGVWVKGDGKAQWLRGELRDADNRGYYLDFTNSTTGINWDGEWKFVQTSLVGATAMGGYKGPMTPPYTVKTLYVAQGQEAAKKDGRILLDGLCALDLPDALAAPAEE